MGIGSKNPALYLLIATAFAGLFMPRPRKVKRNIKNTYFTLHIEIFKGESTLVELLR
jgi:hypothetical protein